MKCRLTFLILTISAVLLTSVGVSGADDWYYVVETLNHKRECIFGRYTDPYPGVSVPHPEDIDWDGIAITKEALQEILPDYGFDNLTDALHCAGYAQDKWSGDEVPSEWRMWRIRCEVMGVLNYMHESDIGNGGYNFHPCYFGDSGNLVGTLGRAYYCQDGIFQDWGWGWGFPSESRFCGICPDVFNGVNKQWLHRAFGYWDTSMITELPAKSTLSLNWVVYNADIDFLGGPYLSPPTQVFLHDWGSGTTLYEDDWDGVGTGNLLFTLPSVPPGEAIWGAARGLNPNIIELGGLTKVSAKLEDETDPYGCPRLDSYYVLYGSGWDPVWFFLLYHDRSDVIAADDFAETHMGVPVSGNVTDNDIGPEGMALDYISPPLYGPWWSLTFDYDGSYTYYPAPGYVGKDYLQYAIRNTGGDPVVGILITITITNTPPAAHDDTATTTQGAGVIINVLANDSDPDGDPLTTALVTDAEHGVAELSPDGTFLYQPESEYIGYDRFTYSITDGEIGATPVEAEVQVTILPPPPEPPDPEHTTLYVTIPGINTTGETMIRGAQLLLGNQCNVRKIFEADYKKPSSDEYNWDAILDDVSLWSSQAKEQDTHLIVHIDMDLEWPSLRYNRMWDRSTTWAGEVANITSAAFKEKCPNGVRKLYAHSAGVDAVYKSLRASRGARLFDDLNLMNGRTWASRLMGTLRACGYNWSQVKVFTIDGDLPASNPLPWEPPWMPWVGSLSNWDATSDGAERNAWVALHCFEIQTGSDPHSQLPNDLADRNLRGFTVKIGQQTRTFRPVTVDQMILKNWLSESTQ